MGEIAEMMLDGTMCEGCGVFMDDILDGAEPPGFAQRCSGCGGDADRHLPGKSPAQSEARRRKRARRRERDRAAVGAAA